TWQLITSRPASGLVQCVFIAPAWEIKSADVAWWRSHRATTNVCRVAPRCQATLATEADVLGACAALRTLGTRPGEAMWHEGPQHWSGVTPSWRCVQARLVVSRPEGSNRVGPSGRSLGRLAHCGLPDLMAPWLRFRHSARGHGGFESTTAVVARRRRRRDPSLDRYRSRAGRAVYARGLRARRLRGCCRRRCTTAGCDPDGSAYAADGRNRGNGGGHRVRSRRVHSWLHVV